jgi:hypothetical protein
MNQVVTESNESPQPNETVVYTHLQSQLRLYLHNQLDQYFKNAMSDTNFLAEQAKAVSIGTNIKTVLEQSMYLLGLWSPDNPEANQRIFGTLLKRYVKKLCTHINAEPPTPNSNNVINWREAVNAATRSEPTDSKTTSVRITEAERSLLSLKC